MIIPHFTWFQLLSIEKRGELKEMLKIKLLNKSDQQWLDGRKDVETQLEIYSSIINANDRVRAMKQPRTQPSESLVHYAKEQSLWMWLEESPFLAEMKKARTGNASWQKICGKILPSL